MNSALQEDGHSRYRLRRKRRKRRHYPEFVVSLSRGLLVLQTFGPAHPRLTLSEVARLTGFSPATARRSLLTLHAMGFLNCANRRFSLNAQVLRLSEGYIQLIPPRTAGESDR